MGWKRVSGSLWLDVLVIVLSFTSLLLCARSLLCGYRLAKQARSLFREHPELGVRISSSDFSDILNLWYVLWDIVHCVLLFCIRFILLVYSCSIDRYILIILTDLAVILGSALKLFLDYKVLQFLQALYCN